MIFYILTKKIRTKQEMEIIEKAFSHLPFFEELKKTLPNSLYKSLLQELKYQSKIKHSLLSQQGI